MYRDALTQAATDAETDPHHLKFGALFPDRYPPKK